VCVCVCVHVHVCACVNVCYMRFKHPTGYSRNVITKMGRNASGTFKDILVQYLAGDCLTLLKPATVCCLAMWEYCLHIDAHVSLGGVMTTNNTEAQPFVARSLGK